MKACWLCGERLLQVDLGVYACSRCDLVPLFPVFIETSK